jgi:hypothetical protein
MLNDGSNWVNASKTVIIEKARKIYEAFLAPSKKRIANGADTNPSKSTRPRTVDLPVGLAAALPAPVIATAPFVAPAPPMAPTPSVALPTCQ